MRRVSTVRSTKYGWHRQQRKFEVCDALHYENEAKETFGNGWDYDS